MKAPIKPKDDDGNLLGEKDSVNVFAKYFHSVYSKDFLPHFNKRSNVSFGNIEIDIVDIVDVDRCFLPSKYSIGFDNIPNILLTNLHSLLALPLSLIFQHKY